jgi:hypothetical protein
MQSYGRTNGAGFMDGGGNAMAGGFMDAAGNIMAGDVADAGVMGALDNSMGMWSADVESGFLAAQMADKIDKRERYGPLAMHQYACLFVCMHVCTCMHVCMYAYARDEKTAITPKFCGYTHVFVHIGLYVLLQDIRTHVHASQFLYLCHTYIRTWHARL